MKTLALVGTFVATMTLGGLASAQDHAHKAPHGGQVKTVGKYHLEALLKDSMLHVYLLDDKEKTLPPPPSARAILQMGSTKHDVKLAPSGDMLMASLPAEAAKHLADAKAKTLAIVTVTLDGKAQSARFSFAGEQAGGAKAPDGHKDGKPGAHQHGAEKKH